MNEIAMICDRMHIDTDEVLAGMNTKWNALGFKPGLVGGHCIGVDPYYFTYEAEKLGYHSQIILNGRIVNDSMGAFVADAVPGPRGFRFFRRDRKIRGFRLFRQLFLQIPDIQKASD